MKYPDLKDSKGMLLEGGFATQCTDSSGEVVKIAGINIDLMEEGKSVVDYEHLGPDGGHGREIVGKVVYVKKIYGYSDCENDSQQYFFEQAHNTPILYGIVRLYDGAQHAGAMALAAIVRDGEAAGDLPILNWSIEGSTLEKDGNIIANSIARRVALTLSACNKTAIARIVADPNAPVGFDKVDRLKEVDVVKSEMLQDPMNRRIGGAVTLSYNPVLGTSRDLKDPVLNLIKNVTVLKALVKTTTAGSYDAAPSALTGGACLQREDLRKVYTTAALATARDYDGFWDKKRFKKRLQEAFNKAQLPEVSEQFLDHFTNIADDWRVKKSEDKDPNIAKLLKLTRELEEDLVELRKTAREIETGPQSPPLPEVYQVEIDRNGEKHPAGRFAVVDNNLYHLEDYHGILDTLLPQGPVDLVTDSTLGSMLRNPSFTITNHKIPVEEPKEEQKQVQITKVPVPDRPAVFDYYRPGMAKPHVVEFSDHGAALDGKALDQDELDLILENAENGIATIRWRSAYGELRKDEIDMDPDALLQHIRAAEKSGHLPTGSGAAYTKHLYEDPMVTGVGNKAAATNFKNKNNAGVYASIDLNGFKGINDTHGHTAGDEAIKAAGGAFREASAKSGNIKLFRNGGDEFIAHAPTLEHMSHFLRHASNHVDALPLIGGTHKQSFSVGVGHNFDTADKALYHAKAQKLDPVSKSPIYGTHNTPNLGHSLYPGSEGALFKPESKPVQEHLPKLAS